MPGKEYSTCTIMISAMRSRLTSLFALTIVILVVLVAAPDARAGSFSVAWCGNNTAGTGVDLGGSGFSVYPGMEYSERNFAGNPPRSLVWGRACTSGGGTDTDSGYFVRARRCDEVGGWLTTVMGGSGVNTCTDSEATSGKYYATGFQLSNPDPNVYLNAVTVLRGMRTQVPSAVTNRFMWFTRLQFSDGGGSWWVPWHGGEYQACENPGAGTYECVRGAGVSPSQLSWGSYGAFTGNASYFPRAFRVEMSCGNATFGSRCANWGGDYVAYAARANLRRMLASITDNSHPGTSNVSTNWDQSCWHQPDGRTACNPARAAGTAFVYGADFSDPSGLFAWNTTMNSVTQNSGTWQASCAVRSDSASFGGPTYYRTDTPCPGSSRVDRAFTGVPDGTSSVSVTVSDVSGNATTLPAATIRVDNTVTVCTTPGACDDPPPASNPSCPNSNMVIRNPTLSATGNAGGTEGWRVFGGARWIKDTVWLRACANDANSGAHQMEIQWQRNGGAWNTVCATSRAANNPGSLTNECPFNTTTLSQGDQIRFRVWMMNGSGLTASHELANTYRVDNTPAPTSTLSVSGLSPASSAVSVSTHRGGTGWTNAESLEAWWDQDNNTANGRQPWNDGPGSGIDRIEYRYTPDVDGGGAGNCPTTSILSISSTATATSPLRADRRDQCRQGLHRVEVRTVDNMNNVSPWVSTTFNYDSYPTPETRDLAWPCQGKTPSRNCFRPRSFLVNPIGWSATNSFTLSWTNPTYNGTSEAPLVAARIRAEVAGAGLSGSGDIKSYSGCLGSGAACSLPGLQISPDVGGSYPVRIWLRDAAGNAEEEESASGTINYSSNQCTRRN